MTDPKELIKKLLAGKKRTRSAEVQALLQDAADMINTLRHKTVEEALEECRKWHMTDEEVEELLK